VDYIITVAAAGSGVKQEQASASISKQQQTAASSKQAATGISTYRVGQDKYSIVAAQCRKLSSAPAPLETMESQLSLAPCTALLQIRPVNACCF
jgi:hypothetical protein